MQAGEHALHDPALTPRPEPFNPRMCESSTQRPDVMCEPSTATREKSKASILRSLAIYMETLAAGALSEFAYDPEAH